MDLKECYEALHGDYDGAMARLGERILCKFAAKFTSDGSYTLLQDSLAAGNLDEAFRAAHTIKGICLNLGFTQLGESSAALTEALRAKDADEAARLLPQTVADYEMTIAALSQLEA